MDLNQLQNFELGRASRLTKFLYYTQLEGEPIQSRRCVVAVDATHAVTYAHGTVHSKYKENDFVLLYNVASGLNIKVKVVQIDAKSRDVIIFETVEGTFPDYPSGGMDPCVGERYVMARFDNGEPTVDVGIIRKKKGKFFIGSHFGQLGDSGGAVFSLYEEKLLGMVVSRQNQSSDYMYTRMNDFLCEIKFPLGSLIPYPKIVPTTLLAVLQQQVEESSSPPLKKTNYGDTSWSKEKAGEGRDCGSWTVDEEGNRIPLEDFNLTHYLE